MFRLTNNIGVELPWLQVTLSAENRPWKEPRRHAKAKNQWNLTESFLCVSCARKIVNFNRLHSTQHVDDRVSTTSRRCRRVSEGRDDGWIEFLRQIADFLAWKYTFLFISKQKRRAETLRRDSIIIKMVSSYMLCRYVTSHTFRCSATMTQAIRMNLTPPILPISLQNPPKIHLHATRLRLSTSLERLISSSRVVCRARLAVECEFQLWKSWRHIFTPRRRADSGGCMRGKRANKLITSPSTKNNYTLSTEDKNHMSRALSRTMKLPNAEKPFQCNVCEKQVSEEGKLSKLKFFFWCVVKETSTTSNDD